MKLLDKKIWNYLYKATTSELPSKNNSAMNSQGKLYGEMCELTELFTCEMCELTELFMCEMCEIPYI